MNKEEVGSKIKDIRKRNKISQTDLAKRLGVTTASVLSWEKGLKKISLDHLYKLATFFDIDLNQFILGDEYKEHIQKLNQGNGHLNKEMEELKTKYQKLLEEHISLYNEFRELEKKFKKKEET